MSRVVGRLQIRHLLVVLLAVPALYLTFVLYHTGNLWIALGLLVVTCWGSSFTSTPQPRRFDISSPDFSVLGSSSSFRWSTRFTSVSRNIAPRTFYFRPE